MPFDAKSLAVKYLTSRGVKVADTRRIMVDVDGMRNLTMRRLKSRIGRAKFEISILVYIRGSDGEIEQVVKNYRGSVTERMLNKNAREAIQILLKKIIESVELEYDVAGGILIEASFIFLDGSVDELGARGIPVIQVEMFGGENAERHMLPGVDLDESNWNTLEGTCVIDWLHQHFKNQKADDKHNKKGLTKYAHESTGREFILKKFKEACPTLGEGITTENIIEFAKHVKELSVHAYSIDGSLIASHIGESKSSKSLGKGTICFYVSGSHFQPITNRDVVRSITNKRSNSKITEAVAEVEYKEEEDNTIVVHGDDLGAYDEHKTVCTSRDLEQVMVEHINATGNIPQAWSRGTKIVKLKAGNTTMVQNEHSVECEDIAKQYGIQYKGEGPGSLACRISTATIKKSSTHSGYNQETKRIFNQIVAPHTKTVLAKPKKSEKVQAFDVRRCYTNILLNRRDKWPIFTANAVIEPFNGNIMTGTYFVITDNCFPLKRTGWYPDCLIRDCLDMGVIKLDDIKKQVIACNTLPADFFIPFVESVKEKINDKLQKKVINYFIGCLAKTEATSNSRCFVSRSEDICIDIYHRLAEKQGQYPCIRESNGLYFTDYYLEKCHVENSVPIHRAIICSAWSACYKLFRKLGPCRLLAVSTDCVHLGSNVKLENPDETIYREEPRKPDDWFFVQDVDVQEEVGKIDIDIEVVAPPECDDFAKHAKKHIGESMMILAPPGSGKTRWAIEFCKLLDKEGLRYLRCAPTNKAALNLEGSTIHTGLGLTVGSCDLRPGYQNRIGRLDYIIIDEISMVNGKIWDRLHKLHALYPNIQFMLIGDPRQLPPVESVRDAPRQDAVRTWAQAAVDRARRRFPGKPFDLTVEYLIKRVNDIEGFSEVLSGSTNRLRVRMSFEHDAEEKSKASIDRIDPNLYYTKDNIRLTTRQENNERGTLSVEDFDQSRDEYVDYTTSRSVLELCRGRIMRMEKNYRSCQRMTKVMNDFIEDTTAEIDIQKTKDIPKVNLAYTNKMCRKINSILMARELQGKTPLVVEASNAVWSQDMYLVEGTPLMCRQGHRNLVNGLFYDVLECNEAGIEVLSRKEEAEPIWVDLEHIQTLFTVGYCVTVHKSQGDTIREPYAIHEWHRLSNRAKYTAMSRTDAWEKVFIYDDEKEFTETCDVRMAKYLISRSDAELTEIMKKDVDQDFENDKRLVNQAWAEERRIQKSASKLKTTRDYCHLVVKHNGKVPMRYQHAKGREFGRLFAIGPCLQRVPATVRGALLRTTQAYDIDMCSAHPNLLRGIAKDLDITCPALEEYCKNRAKVLQKTGLTKVDFLVEINKDKNTDSLCPFMIQFKNEVKDIQDAAWNSELFKKFPKDPERYNPKGSHLNLILCDRENAVLQKVLPVDAIGMFFDGFMSRRQLDIDDLNNRTAIHGITWAYKPHDDSIQIPEDWQP